MLILYFTWMGNYNLTVHKIMKKWVHDSRVSFDFYPITQIGSSVIYSNLIAEYTSIIEKKIYCNFDVTYSLSH